MKSQRRILFPLGLTLILALFPMAALYAAQTFYQTHNLVSNQPGVADHTDSNLKNAWGMHSTPTPLSGLRTMEPVFRHCMTGRGLPRLWSSPSTSCRWLRTKRSNGDRL